MFLTIRKKKIAVSFPVRNFGQGPFSGSEEELLDTCDSKWWRSVLSIVEVDKV